MKKLLEKNKAKLRVIGEIISLAWAAVLFELNFTGVIPQKIQWIILAFVGLLVFVILVFLHIYSLEKQLSPKLDLVFGDYSSCCHKFTSDTLCFILFRVGLINLGGKTVDDIRVSLESLEPQGITFGPIKLLFMNQRGSGEEFKLHPGEKPTLFVDVIQDCLIDEPSGMQRILALQYAVSNVPNSIEHGNYRLTLLAEGKDVPPCRKSFLVTWDGEKTGFTEERDTDSRSIK